MHNVELHFFMRIARPSWPVFKFSRFINYLVQLVCWVTNQNVVRCMFLRADPLEQSELTQCYLT